MDCVETGPWDVYNECRFEFANEADTVDKGALKDDLDCLVMAIRKHLKSEKIWDVLTSAATGKTVLI